MHINHPDKIERIHVFFICTFTVLKRQVQYKTGNSFNQVSLQYNPLDKTYVSKYVDTPILKCI